MEDKEN